MDERVLVRTIVCAYDRDELPTKWLQVHRRFEHELKKAGLRVRVRLEPLDALPESCEVIVVAPELERQARAIAPATRIITATREDSPLRAAALVHELREGRPLYAERASPDDPIVVVHRGPEIL